MRASRAAWAVLAAAAFFAPIGCMRTCPATRLSQDQLVAEYNANAARVPRLWARTRIRLEIRRPGSLPMAWGSASTLASPNGKLLLAKDDDPAATPNFVLIGGESLALELFRMGTSAEEGVYYLWYNYGDRGEAWWGRSELAGAPGLNMPLDPAQLLSVLGVMELPADFTDLPTVTLRMTHLPGQRIPASETCAYVLTWLDRQPLTGRIGATREVYFNWDEETPRPYMVKLFSRTGEQLLTARMDDYRPIATDAATPAVMPTDIELTWQDTGSSLHLRLSEMTDEDKWDPEVALFIRWLPDGIPPGNIVQIDAGLNGGDEQ